MGNDENANIANAVESGVTEQIAVESSTNDAENGDNVDRNEEDSETVTQPVIMPTMPEHQRDDNATDSVQSAVNNDDAETPTADNADGQILTPQKIITPQKDEFTMEQKPLDNAGLVVNTAQQYEQEMERQAVADDEDVDTPLADEIDF